MRAAVQTGTLPAGRLESFQKLQQELAYQATRQDQQAQIAQKRTWKVINKSVRQMYKSREKH